MKPLIAVMFSLVFAGGCLLGTDEPLSDPATAEADPSMYGHWVVPPRADDETGEEIHLFIGQQDVKGNPKSIMNCAFVNWKTKQQQVGSTKFSFTMSRVGNESYVNLFFVAGDQEPSDLSEEGSYAKWTDNKQHCCAVLRYSCDGKVLRFWNYEKDVYTQLLKDKQLESTKRGTEECAKASSVVAYLEKNGSEKLFKNFMFEAHKVP
jgi:hypothetical protein